MIVLWTTPGRLEGSGPASVIRRRLHGRPNKRGPAAAVILPLAAVSTRFRLPCGEVERNHALTFGIFRGGDLKDDRGPSTPNDGG